MVKGKIASNLEERIENDEIKLITINETPFGILKNKKTKVYRIIFGNNIISKNEFTSIERAYNYIMRTPWELIVNVMMILIDKITNLNKQNND